MTTELPSASSQHPPISSRRNLRAHAWAVATLGVVLIIGGALLYLFNQNRYLEAQLGAGLGGVLLLGAVLLRPEVVRTALAGRPVKYASNALITSLAFVGILALLNFLGLKYEHEFDLTETGLFTLSEQTINTLANIDQPVQILGFFQSGDPRLKRAREYLERYSHYTPYLSYEFHDPNIEPALAQSVGLTNYGLVFVSGYHSYETAGVDEQSITSGLIRVTRDQPRKIYFLTGHGQPRLDDGGKEGYSAVQQALERENYQLDTLNLSATAGAIPADATALILAGAERALSATETQLLTDWLATGGKLMILIGPLAPVPLEQLLRTYGIEVNNDFVVEDYNHALVTLGPHGLQPQLLAPLVVKYPYHEITRGLNGFQSFYPFARSITLNPPPDFSKNVAAILSTSPGSWAETDVHAAEPEYHEGVDYPGPLHLGVAVEDGTNEARLVVIGNSRFVTNQNASSQMANLDLFMNAVNWLTEEEELISIRPKQPQDRRLYLTPAQVNMTLLTSVIIMPLAVFAVGLAIWWKRR